MKIGFIGLGNVGGKLAGSLLRNKFNLTVLDLNDNFVKDFFKLNRFRVTDERRWNAKGKLITESEATINVNVNSEEIMTVGTGNGPVNAIDSALRKALIKFFTNLENLKLSDYKVMILSPEKGTGAITRVFIESVDEKNKHWTTIGVSPNIIDASYNCLLYTSPSPRD